MNACLARQCMARDSFHLAMTSDYHHVTTRGEQHLIICQFSLRQQFQNHIKSAIHGGLLDLFEVIRCASLQDGMPSTFRAGGSAAWGQAIRQLPCRTIFSFGWPDTVSVIQCKSAKTL